MSLTPKEIARVNAQRPGYEQPIDALRDELSRLRKAIADFKLNFVEAAGMHIECGVYEGEEFQNYRKVLIRELNAILSPTEGAQQA